MLGEVRAASFSAGVVMGKWNQMCLVVLLWPVGGGYRGSF